MKIKLTELSNAMNFYLLMPCKANYGHPGMPMGMADVSTVLLNTTSGLILNPTG